MVAKVAYVFNIVNFDKINSQFNYGMQPVMFSTREYLLNGCGMYLQVVDRKLLFHDMLILQVGSAWERR